MTITLRPASGEHIVSIAKRAVQLAAFSRNNVKFVFNRINIKVERGASIMDVVEQYLVDSGQRDDIVTLNHSSFPDGRKKETNG